MRETALWQAISLSLPVSPDGRVSLARSFFSVLGSGVIVNATTFAVLAAAPLVLAVEEFARLSLAVAGVMFLVAVLDLGLSVTSTRQFAATRDPAYLSLSVRMRLLLCAGLGVPAVAAMAWPVALPFAVVVLGAAALNLWMGLRAADQAREDFKKFSRSNLAFAAARLLFGGAALLTGSWVAVAISLFVAPVIAIGMMKFTEMQRLTVASPKPVVWQTVKYAAWVAMSAACYNAIMALPAAVAGSRLDAVGIGTIGLAATFVGPVSLINNAIRLIVLPKISAVSDGANGRMTRATWAALTLAMGVFTLLLAGAAHLIYAVHYPAVGAVVGVIVGSVLFAVPIGLLNMDVHRQGVPWIEAWANLVRLCLAAPVLWLAGQSVYYLATAAGMLLLLGEAGLFFALRWYRHRSRA